MITTYTVLNHTGDVQGSGLSLYEAARTVLTHGERPDMRLKVKSTGRPGDYIATTTRLQRARMLWWWVKSKFKHILR